MRTWERQIRDRVHTGFIGSFSGVSVILSLEEISGGNCGRMLVLREVGETNREIRIPGEELRPVHESYPDRVSVGWNKLLINGHIRIGYAHPFPSAGNIAIHPKENTALFIERPGEPPIQVLYAYITPTADDNIRLSFGSRPVKKKILLANGLGFLALALFFVLNLVDV